MWVRFNKNELNAFAISIDDPSNRFKSYTLLSYVEIVKHNSYIFDDALCISSSQVLAVFLKVVAHSVVFEHYSGFDKPSWHIHDTHVVLRRAVYAHPRVYSKLSASRCAQVSRSDSQGQDHRCHGTRQRRATDDPEVSRRVEVVVCFGHRCSAIVARPMVQR